jgi:hypothetical protein
MNCENCELKDIKKQLEKISEKVNNLFNILTCSFEYSEIKTKYNNAKPAMPDCGPPPMQDEYTKTLTIEPVGDLKIESSSGSCLAWDASNDKVTY